MKVEAHISQGRSTRRASAQLHLETKRRGEKMNSPSYQTPHLLRHLTLIKQLHRPSHAFLLQLLLFLLSFLKELSRGVLDLLACRHGHEDQVALIEPGFFGTSFVA